MTRSYNFYPRAIYQFLNDIAFKNNVSVKEVETMFLRKQIEYLGFSCQHTLVGFAKSTGLPFCQDCWTRLEQLKPPVYFKGKVIKQGEYRKAKTFLDDAEQLENLNSCEKKKDIIYDI